MQLFKLTLVKAYCETSYHSGECKLIRECPELLKIYLSKENNDVIKNSRCGLQGGNKLRVCCPFGPITLPTKHDGTTDSVAKKTTLSPSTSTRSTTTLTDTTPSTLRALIAPARDASRSRMLKLAEKPCTDPNNNKGICIQLKTCSKLLQLATNLPVSRFNREFLKKSQCDNSNGKPYVCCANGTVEEATLEETTLKPVKTSTPVTISSLIKTRTTTSTTRTTTTTESSMEPWLKKLKNLLPKAPNCGPDAPDRIFGGQLTTIGEFPWAVLLNYDKGLTLKNPSYKAFLKFAF